MIRPWHRRLLTWARIEDEHSVLSLTTVAFAAGVWCLVSGHQVSLPELSAFGLALGAYHAKKHLRARTAAAAMDGAHEHAMAQLEHANAMEKQKRADGAEDLAKKVEELASQVRELATPERMAAFRDIVGKRR